MGLIVFIAIDLVMLFTFIEHSRPLIRFKLALDELARGTTDQLQASKVTGVFRKLVTQINDGIDHAVAKGGGDNDPLPTSIFQSDDEAVMNCPPIPVFVHAAQVALTFRARRRWQCRQLPIGKLKQLPIKTRNKQIPVGALGERTHVIPRPARHCPLPMC